MPPEAPGRRGFIFDSANCSGCKACQVACKDKHNLGVGVNWRRVVEVSGGGWQQQGAAWVSDVFAYNISLACSHCQQPVCVEACPSQALYQRPDGIVLIDEARCLGCGYCAWACPYGAPQYDRQTGKMTKCDLCVDELAQDKAPACVAACPLRTLTYGELPAEELTPAVFPLPAAALTVPAWQVRPHPQASRANAATAGVANWEEI